MEDQNNEMGMKIYKNIAINLQEKLNVYELQ